MSALRGAPRGRPTGSRRCRRAADRGTVSVEFAIVMSALIVGFFTLMIMAGRIMQQENDVRSAAHAAARAASLRDDFHTASSDAVAVGARNLAESGVSCRAQRISVVSPASAFVPGGVVTVRVECTAGRVGNLSLGSNTYWYEATEVIDDFRSDP